MKLMDADLMMVYFLSAQWCQVDQAKSSFDQPAISLTKGILPIALWFNLDSEFFIDF